MATAAAIMVSGLTRSCIAGLFLLLVSASANAQYSAAASWDANPDNSTAGYRLYYGTSSGNYAWSLDVGNQTTALLSLSTGQYFFTVRAYNSSYEYGPPSAEVTFTAGSTTDAPKAKISSSLPRGNSVDIGWNTRNAVSATINGVAVALSGFTTVTLTGTTTYTLVAVGATGETATSSTTVTIGSSDNVASTVDALAEPATMAALVAGSPVR